MNMAKPYKKRRVKNDIYFAQLALFSPLNFNIVYLECNKYGEQVSKWNKSFIKDEYSSNPSQSHDRH